MTLTHPALPIACATAAMLITCPTALAQTLAKPKLPDLTADLVVTAAKFVACNRFGVTVRNAGALAIGSPFTVRLRLFMDEGGMPERTVDWTSGLGGYASTTVIFEDVSTSNRAGPGGYVLPFDVTVDSANTVAEANETNNLHEIGDMERWNCPLLSVVGDSAREGENVEFRVSISNAFAQPVKVVVATKNGTATATPLGATTCTGGDFLQHKSTLTFPAGTTTLSQTVPVPTCNDLPRESTETFTLHLSSPTNALLPQVPTATGTITQ